MKNKNPVSKSDKIAKRVEPELETDQFGPDEAKKIVDMVIADNKVGWDTMQNFIAQRKLDLQHYAREKPSILESLTKKSWQSDRNLGLCPAVCDAYQATLLATCWNPGTIHFIPTEENDVDHTDNLKRFTKWAIGKHESNVTPEVDDFVHNRIVQGASFFKIRWKVWYEYVDRRIPKKAGGYTIKTERVRFEKGLMENIPNLDDIRLPNFGKNIQELSFFVYVLHKTSEEALDYFKRNIYKQISKDKAKDSYEKFIDKLKNVCVEEIRKTLDKEKAEQIGISDVTNQDLRVFPIDLLEWYGTYKKGRREEKYRFVVEPYTMTLLSGKPLRKITRTGKIPFAGGALIRVPGKVRGKSLPWLISPVINAINNVFNQKSDFQYVENCPFGFYVAAEGYTEQEMELIPGVMYPVAAPISESIHFPNLQRSMAWADTDIKLLFEILERLTGAASYFMTSERGVSGTATRDVIINEKSETRFGLWVRRIIDDICEALTMYVNMYQDWAPPKLGERVLGEDGKQLIRNLSVESLRGGYDTQMSPDIIAGSKTLEKQIQMWAFENLQQTIWLQPQVNPKGNWNLVADTLKVMGKQDVERYIGPEPKSKMGESRQIEDEWARFIQGDVFDPEQGDNPLEHLIGHMGQKADKYYDLDPEYRPNFDDHLFKTYAQFQEFVKMTRQEQTANQFALGMIGEGRPERRGAVE